jgi:hypothetical protein
MEDRFFILFSLKTLAGYEVFGEFGIGEDGPAAAVLFDSLQGDENLNDAALLHIDLVETDGLLPGRIKTKCCRLDELAVNCKLITREVFRQKTLDTYEE